MELKEYTEGIDKIKEREISSDKKVFKAFDEDDNLLYHDVGSFGGGAYWDNCIFHCSKCFKQYFSRGHMKRHALKCNGLFEDGIHKITKYPPKVTEQFINLFSKMSRITQGNDFSISDEAALRQADKTVLFLVKNKRPMGYITFCKRKFSNEEKISIDDFFVLENQRRKGIGNILFDAMLKELNIISSEEIIKNIVVNKPSVAFSRFLIKRNYLGMGVW